MLYVAGPYSEQDHIKRAEQVCISLIRSGFHVISPHKNTAGYEKYEDNNITFDTWIGMDLNILNRCDGLYLFGDWSHSKGAMIEFRFAHKHTMPIFRERLFPADTFTFGDFYRLEIFITTNSIEALKNEAI